MRELLMAAFSMVLMSVPSPAKAYCAGSINQLIELSEVIFLGIPEQQTTFPPGREISHNAADWYTELTTFRVVELLKGDRTAEIKIWTCPSCGEGLSFDLGKLTLVSASLTEGKLSSSYCSLSGASLDQVRIALGKKE